MLSITVTQAHLYRMRANTNSKLEELGARAQITVCSRYILGGSISSAALESTSNCNAVGRSGVVRADTLESSIGHISKRFIYEIIGPLT